MKKIENIVMFRLDMFQCDPQEISKKLLPKNIISYAWIPQTMGDQVWFWLEFKNELDKNEYLQWLETANIQGSSSQWDSINTNAKDMLMHIDQNEMDHWIGFLKNPPNWFG